jgi:hypothetical protein
MYVSLINCVKYTLDENKSAISTFLGTFFNTLNGFQLVRAGSNVC